MLRGRRPVVRHANRRNGSSTRAGILGLKRALRSRRCPHGPITEPAVRPLLSGPRRAHSRAVPANTDLPAASARAADRLPACRSPPPPQPARAVHSGRRPSDERDDDAPPQHPRGRILRRGARFAERFAMRVANSDTRVTSTNGAGASGVCTEGEGAGAGGRRSGEARYSGEWQVEAALACAHQVKPNKGTAKRRALPIAVSARRTLFPMVAKLVTPSATAVDSRRATGRAGVTRSDPRERKRTRWAGERSDYPGCVVLRRGAGEVRSVTAAEYFPDPRPSLCRCQKRITSYSPILLTSTRKQENHCGKNLIPALPRSRPASPRSSSLRGHTTLDGDPSRGYHF
jgi:hypothetical protein